MIIRYSYGELPKFVLRCSYEAALRKGVTTALGFTISSGGDGLMQHCQDICIVTFRAVSITRAVVYMHDKFFTRVIISRPGTQTCELSLKSLHEHVCILCLHAQCVSVCGVWNRFLCM